MLRTTTDIPTKFESGFARFLTFYDKTSNIYDVSSKRQFCEYLMAKKKHKSSLAAGEMELLSLLWQHGPMTLSEAHQEFGASIGYTTMQTRLNRLADKGLVHRSDARPAKYSAAVAPEDISANQLDVLIHRVTDGRVVPLVAQLVNKRSLSATEIEEIKQLIEQAEKRVLRKGKTK